MNELTGQVMAQFECYLQQNATDVVIVVDDLASTMAVAIVTKKQGVQLAHIAAGTRSFDITMPKEINRLVIDGLSDILFTAGISNNSIANKEGAELSKVYMVGNVLIDNIRFLQSKMQRPEVMDEFHLKEGEYMVLTLNRKAIVNNIDEMKSLISVIDEGAPGWSEGDWLRFEVKPWASCSHSRLIRMRLTISQESWSFSLRVICRLLILQLTPKV